MISKKYWRPTGDYRHLSKSERRKAIDEEYRQLVESEKQKQKEKSSKNDQGLR